MTDAGEIKAKVVITYDGSGVDKAKRDLEELANSAGALEEGANQGSEGLAGLDEQAQKTAKSTENLNSAVTGMEKPLERANEAVTGMTEAVQEHQEAIQNVGEEYQKLQKPVEEVTTQLQNVSPAMEAVSKQSESTARQLTPVNDGFVQMSANLEQASSAFPQYTDRVNTAGDAWGAAGNNLQTFQEALASPEPFQVIDEHLDRTGQSYSDFADSLSTGNQQLLHEMSTDWAQTSTWIDTAGANFADMGKSGKAGFEDVTVSANEAHQAVADFMGVGGEASKGKISAGNFMSEDVLSGAMGFLNDLMMPMMAVQMVSMAVGAVGQSIYDAAAIAEGPGAHGFGTFTGAVDTFTASTNKAWQSFSEGFGKGALPSIEGINNADNSNKGIDWGWLGQGFGMEGGIALDIGKILLGGLVGGAAKILTLNPGNTTGDSWWKGGVQGLQNYWADWTGQPEPFQGPPPPHVNPMQGNIDQMYAQANNPQYLAAQAYYQSAYGKAVQNQQSWDVSHYSGTYGPMDPMNQILQAQAVQAAGGTYGTVNNPYLDYSYLNQPTSSSGGGQTGRSGGPDFWGSIGKGLDFIGGLGAQWNDMLYGTKGGGLGGVGDFFGGLGQTWNDIWSSQQQYDQNNGIYGSTGGGCFIAGTLVLMADGTSKAIETLQTGERVLAHDGQKQVKATITDCITFPAKQTYKLVFSDGTILFTTDSHPIATTQGWKSISPESTKLENPGLLVTPLEVGDNIYTADGACYLLSIDKRDIVQVYNITVNACHTYYANGVLVHNAKMSAGGVGSEQVQLNHTFTANIQWEANNLQKQFTGVANWVGQGLSNTFQGIANWVAQGLSNTFQGIANWVGQGLSNTFQGVANWIGQGLSNTFQGVANWVGQGLSNTFQGVANWIGQGLENTFKGVANWIGQGLENTFKGKADWVGQGLEHTFNAVANWTAQNLTPNFTVNPSFTMLAEGTSNWGGGPAIVGEAGTELVESNGHYSLFDQGAAFVNLPAGSNVYPMKNLASSSVAQFADGTGSNNSFMPVSFGSSSGGSYVINITHVTQLDGRTIMKESTQHLATAARQLTGGKR